MRRVHRGTFGALGDVIAGLPPGRHRVEVVPADDGGAALTPEGEEEIEAAMHPMDAGP